MWLKRIFWYNMFDLEMRGKDIRLARKSVPQILAATIILLTIDFFLWDLRFWTDRISDDSLLEPARLLGAKFIGKVLGLIILGCCYFLIFISISRRAFFEQVLKTYEAMTLVQKDEEAQKGKYLIVIPLAIAILLLCYIIFFRLD